MMMKLILALIITVFALQIHGFSEIDKNLLTAIRNKRWAMAESIFKLNEEESVSPEAIRQSFQALCESDSWFAAELVHNHYLKEPMLQQLSIENIEKGFMTASQASHGRWAQVLYEMLLLPEYKDSLEASVPDLFMASSMHDHENWASLLEFLWKTYPSFISTRTIRRSIFSCATHSHWQWAALTDKMMYVLDAHDKNLKLVLNNMIQSASKHETDRWVSVVEYWIFRHSELVTQETLKLVYMEASKNVRNTHWTNLVKKLHENKLYAVDKHTMSHMESFAHLHQSNSFAALVQEIKKGMASKKKGRNVVRHNKNH